MDKVVGGVLLAPDADAIKFLFAHSKSQILSQDSAVVVRFGGLRKKLARNKSYFIFTASLGEKDLILHSDVSLPETLWYPIALSRYTDLQEPSGYLQVI